LSPQVNDLVVSRSGSVWYVDANQDELIQLRW
jgi:hypothetical protein